MDEPSLARVIRSVQNALDLAYRGFSQEAIDALNELELELREGQKARLDSEVGVSIHTTLWVSMQRAALLSELALFAESAAVLSELLISIAGLSSEDSPDCFCQETILSSLELSKVYAAQGRFNDAVFLLQDLNGRLPMFHYSAEQLIDETIESLVSMWGNYLGYDNLENRLGLSNTGVSSTSALEAPLDHWQLPLPLRGSEFSRFEKSFREAVWRVDAMETSDIIAVCQSTRSLCEELTKWCEEAQFSVEVKGHLTRFLCMKAENEIELDQFEVFESTMEKLEPLLGEMANEFPENIFLRIRLAHWLSKLSIKILFHDYGDEEEYHRLHWYGADCITSAQAILDAITTDCDVTQAVALRQCLVANLGAISQDMISHEGEASVKRNRRDSVLAKVMSRDPWNDLATRLFQEFQPTSPSLDPGIEREVRDWRWSITPLFHD